MIISIGMLSLVWSIENKLNPHEIIEKHNLNVICDWFWHNCAEAILLGCTHFPYIYDELIKVSPIPIIDPTAIMIRLLSD